MCCSKNFIKRVFPFFLTFAVGLFVASFFITIAAPSLRFPLRGERYRHQQQDRLMQIEIERLRDENLRLKSEATGKEDLSDASNLSDAVPAPPMPPMPPPAPTKDFRK